MKTKKSSVEGHIIMIPETIEDLRALKKVNSECGNCNGLMKKFTIYNNRGKCENCGYLTYNHEILDHVLKNKLWDFGLAFTYPVKILERIKNRVSDKSFIF